MNLLKKFKSLFQKSEGADFKDPVKPGTEKLKKNVGKEVFQKTGKLKERVDENTSVKAKSKGRTERTASRAKSKSKESVEKNSNRSAIKKKPNEIKYRKKKIKVDLKKAGFLGKSKVSKPSNSKNK